MNEVEKIYKNAGVEKKEKGYCDCDYMNCPYPEIDPCGKECPYWVSKGIDYPPFTAEKQLELIKWLAYKMHITIGKGLPWGQYDDDWWTVTSKKGYSGTNAYKFEEALAQIVNVMWQDLTEEDKQQIRGILE